MDIYVHFILIYLKNKLILEVWTFVVTLEFWKTRPWIKILLLGKIILQNLKKSHFYNTARLNIQKLTNFYITNSFWFTRTLLKLSSHSISFYFIQAFIHIMIMVNLDLSITLKLFKMASKLSPHFFKSFKLL